MKKYILILVILGSLCLSQQGPKALYADENTPIIHTPIIHTIGV